MSRAETWMEPFYSCLAADAQGKGNTRRYVATLERAVRAGDDHAAYALGSAYLHGLADASFAWAKDARRGLALIRRATRSVHMAMTELASYYEDGEHGLRKSEKRAFQLFVRAVEYGSISARFHLGRCYYFGVGTRPNRRKGLAWMRAAARCGFPAYSMIVADRAWRDMTCTEGTGLWRRFEDGTGARDRGDLEEAVRIFHEILDAADASDTKLIAMTCGQLGFVALWAQDPADPEAAVSYFARAVAARPRWEVGSLALFHALDAAHRMDDALAEAVRYPSQPNARDSPDYVSMLLDEDFEAGLSERSRASLLEARVQLARRSARREQGGAGR